MKVIYKRFENTNGENSWRYTRDNKITSSARVPQEIKDKLEFAPSVEFDLQLDKSLCIFCDAIVTRSRMLNLESVGLCEWHYQHVNLGKIAQQVRENKERKERDGKNSNPQAQGQRKLKRRRRQNKVALNNVG